MIRVIAVLLFASPCLAIAQNQGMVKIPLGNSQIHTENISFKIAEFIDARKDKNIIGIVQRGLNNRKDLASFQKPGIQELHDLLDRSHLVSEEGISVRMNKFYISELSRAFKETAKAEVSFDFFVKSPEGTYYYMASTYASHEGKGGGMDNNDIHRLNIAVSIEKAFVQFSKLKHEADYSIGFTLDELQDSKLTFRDISAMPILQASTYADGFYASFDEFINNSPSIDADCKIKMGKRIKLKCNDKDEEQVAIYGFAKDNQLYILFHEEFFPLIKDENIFYFMGPRVFSARDLENMTNSWIMVGAIGAAVVTTQQGYNSVYAIDLTTGGIQNISDL